MIVALLSWFEEPPAWLAATVASLGRFADHLVAVDGAYGLVEDSIAHPRSGREQVDAIAAAADGSGLGYTIHTRDFPWWGNEVEKRSFLLRLGSLIAGPDGWLFSIDADEVVKRVPTDLREQLRALTVDVATIEFSEANTDQPAPWVESEHQWLPVRTRERGLRRFFRALPGLEVVGNHYSYRAGDGRMLAGDPIGGALEPAAALSCFEVEHWHRFRQPARQRLASTYYRVRDELGIERQPEGTVVG